MRVNGLDSDVKKDGRETLTLCTTVAPCESEKLVMSSSVADITCNCQSLEINDIL